MKILTRSAAALLILSCVLAACGGATATGAPANQASTPAQASSPAQSAAPGGPTAGTGSTSAIDACALITAAEAKAFLGFDPGPGVSTGTPDSPACAYGGSLTFVVQPSAGRARYDADRGAAQGSGKSTDLTGVGDAGYAFVVANTIAQMEIVKGTVLLQVNVQGDPSLQNITVATLTTLGTTAVGRL